VDRQGGGIGGLALALSLQSSLACAARYYETESALESLLGCGDSTSNHAVRELFDLGLTPAQLNRSGVPRENWALVGQKGARILRRTARHPTRVTVLGRNIGPPTISGPAAYVLFQTLRGRAGPRGV